MLRDSSQGFYSRFENISSTYGLLQVTTTTKNIDILSMLTFYGVFRTRLHDLVLFAQVWAQVPTQMRQQVIRKRRRVPKEGVGCRGGCEAS